MFKYQSGHIVPRDSQRIISQPKVIHYTHMVRKLNFGECNCHEKINKIRDEYDNKLKEKDYQIQLLVNRIGVKEKLIQRLEREVKMWEIKEIKWNQKLKEIGNGKDNTINFENFCQFNSYSYTPSKNITVDINNVNVNVNKVLRDITNFQMNSHHILNENHYYNCEIQQKNNTNINSINNTNNNNENENGYEQQQQQQQQQQWQKQNNKSLNSTYISHFNINQKNNTTLHHYNNNNNNNKFQQTCQQLDLPQLFSPQTIQSSYNFNTNFSSQTKQQISSCFDKTSLLMDEIQNLMKKKKKYEFYNTFNIMNSNNNNNNNNNIENSIIEELQNDVDEKDQMDGRFVINNDNNIINNDNDNHNIINNNEYTQQYSLTDYPYALDNSLDLTTYESVQNFHSFLHYPNHNEQICYQKILNDTINLKHTIIQMKQQSNKEIIQIQRYYQDKLNQVIKQLEKEKEKNIKMMNRERWDGSVGNGQKQAEINV